MGFSDFISRTAGSGRALQKAAMAEAKAAQIACKKLLKLVKGPEKAVIRLGKIKKPMTSADLVPEAIRKKIIRTTRGYGTKEEIFAVENKAWDNMEEIMRGLTAALTLLNAETISAKAATQTERDAMISATVKETKIRMDRRVRELEHSMNQELERQKEQLRRNYA